VKASFVLVAVLALALAGCGGSSKSSAPPVAGTQTTEQFLSPTFKGSANAIARQVSAQVAALQKNLEANAEIGNSLQKSNCTGTVNTQLTQRAHSQQEKQIAKALAGACGDIARALQSAHSGDKAKAKQFASQALSQAKLAASATH
jgi:uncharacterized protein YoxC